MFLINHLFCITIYFIFLCTTNIFVKDCSGMFYECYNIKNIDLSSFDSRCVTSTLSMFMYCINLESINLSSFNTRNVKNMTQMFSYCKRLNNINLSSFDTTNVRSLREMFAYCRCLENIDLSSFDITNVHCILNIFAEINIDLRIKCTKEFYKKIMDFNEKTVPSALFQTYSIRE